MTNEDIRYTIEVYKSAKSLTFTDTTDYVTEFGSDNATGLLKITNPVGSIIYQNAGYASDDYSIPDIIMSNDLKTSIEDILFELDADLNIICGTYKVEYKVRAYDPVDDFAIVATATASTKTFEFNGVGSQIDADRLQKTGYFIGITGPNLGTFSVASSVYVNPTLTVVVNETVVDDVLGTSLVYAPATDSDFDFFKSRDFIYCFDEPVVSIDMVADCDTSILTSTDTTDYTAVNNQESISPSNETRVHSISPPKGSGFTPSADTADQIRTEGPNIWTKIWQTTITTDLVYQIERWATNESYWYFINVTVSGYDNLDVECNRCYCEARQCYTNLYDAWVYARSNNQADFNKLNISLLAVTNLWTQLQQAQSCGDSITPYCNDIKAILNSHNCNCDPTTDIVSEEVIPVTSGGSGGTGTVGSRIYVDAGAPSSSLGNDTDIYIDSVAPNNLYQKTAGSWIFQASLQGAAGLDGSQILTGSGVPVGGLGSDGDLYIDTVAPNSYYLKVTGSWVVQGTLQGATGSAGADGTTIIINDIRDYDLPAGTSEEDLGITQSISLAENGDCIDIRGVFLYKNTAATANDPVPSTKTLKLYTDGTIVGVDIVTSTIISENSYIEFNATISRVSDLILFTTVSVEQSGVPGSINSKSFLSSAIANAASFDVKFTGESSFAELADIVLKQLLISKKVI
jgi:hypothetical protein